MTPEPLETLSLLLPEDLSGHTEYNSALQRIWGCPFDQCGGGKTATRYTYTVLNYPDIPQGVQANLFVCGDQVIAGDITSWGRTAFAEACNFRAIGKGLAGGSSYCFRFSGGQQHNDASRSSTGYFKQQHAS